MIIFLVYVRLNILMIAPKNVLSDHRGLNFGGIRYEVSIHEIHTKRVTPKSVKQPLCNGVIVSL